MIIPGSTLYVTSLWLIKSSMVIFYKRLADRTRYQLVYNITLGFLLATWLVLFFDIVFKCYPVQRQWEQILNPERKDASIITTSQTMD
jgi:urea transporter